MTENPRPNPRPCHECGAAASVSNRFSKRYGWVITTMHKPDCPMMVRTFVRN